MYKHNSLDTSLPLFLQQICTYSFHQYIFLSYFLFCNFTNSFPFICCFTLVPFFCLTTFSSLLCVFCYAFCSVPLFYASSYLKPLFFNVFISCKDGISFLFKMKKCKKDECGIHSHTPSTLKQQKIENAKQTSILLLEL